jgi:hypothetical protein
MVWKKELKLLCKLSRIRVFKSKLISKSKRKSKKKKIIKTMKISVKIRMGILTDLINYDYNCLKYTTNSLSFNNKIG